MCSHVRDGNASCPIALAVACSNACTCPLIKHVRMIIRDELVQARVARKI